MTRHYKHTEKIEGTVQQENQVTESIGFDAVQEQANNLPPVSETETANPDVVDDSPASKGLDEMFTHDLQRIIRQHSFAVVKMVLSGQIRASESHDDVGKKLKPFVDSTAKEIISIL